MDHGGEGFVVGVAVAAFVDEADLGVDAFEAAVGWAVFDGGDDAVKVGSDSAGEVDEGLEAAQRRGAPPGAQVPDRVGGVDAVVEVSEAFFEFPGAPEAVAAAA